MLHHNECLSGPCATCQLTTLQQTCRAWRRLTNVVQAQADLEAIRSALLQRRGALINLTGDEATLSAARPLVSDFLESLPAEAAGPADWNRRLDRLSEAICVPTQVCCPH